MGKKTATKRITKRKVAKIKPAPRPGKPASTPTFRQGAPMVAAGKRCPTAHTSDDLANSSDD